MDANSALPEYIPTHQVREFASQLAQDILAGLPAPKVSNNGDSKLLPDNRLTMSLFTELRYGLGTTDVAGKAPAQQLSSIVVRDNAGKFSITYDEASIPTEATDFTLVYANGFKTAQSTIPAAVSKKVTIEVPSGSGNPDARTLLAIELITGTEVILVSFATHTSSPVTP